MVCLVNLQNPPFGGNKQNYDNMEEMTRTPISPELRKLRVGDQTTFPIERYGSVMAVISRLKKELLREGWNVRTIENKKLYELKVIRVS